MRLATSVHIAVVWLLSASTDAQQQAVDGLSGAGPVAPFSQGWTGGVLRPRRCPPGWWFVRRRCEDVNECEDRGQPCPGRFTLCRNTVGSYRCQCWRQHHGDPYSFQGCQPDTSVCGEEEDQLTTPRPVKSTVPAGPVATSTTPAFPVVEVTGPTSSSQDPLGTTSQPTSITEEPTEPTEAPTEPTEAPTEPTEAPTEPTEAPIETTVAPTETTVAPTETTEEPSKPTEEPTEPTVAPTETTVEPTKPTVAPTETTVAPTETTEEPTELTEAPTEPTEAPTEPTEAPIETTEAPIETTEEPTKPTEAPTKPTEEPTKPTEEPTELTEAPTEPTEEPTNPTEAPTETTEAPTETTVAPTETTVAPTEPSEEPTKPTEEPTKPMEEPTKPAEEPTKPTEEPTKPTEELAKPAGDDTTDPTTPLDLFLGHSQNPSESTTETAATATESQATPASLLTSTTEAAVPSNYSRCTRPDVRSGSFVALHSQGVLNRQEAAAVCARDHPRGRLAVIRDETFNDCLQTWFLFHTNVYYAWIGLSWQDGQHVWSDGSTLEDGDFESWQKSSSQPLSPETRQCVRLYSFGGVWETADCDEELAFFCEIEP